MASPTFPVASFRRVFDTVPEQEVLTLAELVACFRRFELKPQLHAKIERECARLDRALEQVRAGENVGERVVQLLEAGREAVARGAREDPARLAKLEELKAEARKEAKKDLRLWSPVKYRDGWTERGTEGVTHVSVLVLDYDGGVRIPEARAVWSEYFHLFHTTWSHTDEHPKFRILLPLAFACPVRSFDALWQWAHEKAAGEFDRALSGPASTYALPVVRDANAPREAGSHAAPLLDPRDLGLAVDLEARWAVQHASPSRMLGDPAKEYLVHETADAVVLYDDPGFDPDEAWSQSPSRTSIPQLTETVPSEPPTVKKPRARKVKKKTIVVDFDGVLHSYASGWKGATVIPDPPVPGAFAFLRQAVERFDVAILSARSREAGGIDAMRTWLEAHGLDDSVRAQLRFPRGKPPAHVYIDDRGWRFEGAFPGLDELDAFEPWYRR